MTMIFGIPLMVLFGQLMLGLINGAFYALLSLGLAVIFGLLRIINFAHGAQYMLGAFAALLGAQYLGLNYWAALIVVPLVVGALGIVVERLLLRRIQHLDHLYGLLLTFGLALIFEGTLVNLFGVSGSSYPIPEALSGGFKLSFMFLPTYRAWVLVAALVVCFGVWFLIERTRLGAYLRAGTENPELVQAFGIRLVVVRRGNQAGIGTEFLRTDLVLDRDGRIVRARAGDHRDAAARRLDDDLDDPHMLLEGQRRVLAGRSAGHQAVRTGLDLAFSQRGNGRLVDGTILERRDQRSDGPFEHVSIPETEKRARDHIGGHRNGQVLLSSLDSEPVLQR